MSIYEARDRVDEPDMKATCRATDTVGARDGFQPSRREGTQSPRACEGFGGRGYIKLGCEDTGRPIGHRSSEATVGRALTVAISVGVLGSCAGAARAAPDYWSVDVAGVRLMEPCAAAAKKFLGPKWRTEENLGSFEFASLQEVVSIHCVKTLTGPVVGSVTYYVSSDLMPRELIESRVQERFGPPDRQGVNPRNVFKRYFMLEWGDVPYEWVVGAKNEPSGNRPFAYYQFGGQESLLKRGGFPYAVTLSAGGDWIKARKQEVEDARIQSLREKTTATF